MLLDIRTDYSLLNSTITIDRLTEFAAKSGWKWVGICDESSGSMLEFYLACKEAGVKPVMGVRFFITDSLERVSKDQIFLYPKNYDGYKDLLKLSSRAGVEGFKDGHGNLVVDWLEGNLANILCLAPVGKMPPKDGPVMTKLRSLTKVYFGLCDRSTAFDDIWLERVGSMPYLPLSNAKYFTPDDLDAYKTLRAINEGNSLERMFERVCLDESIETALKRPTAHQNLLDEFVGQIDLDIPCPGLKVPRFKIPEGFATSYDYLLHLCREGFKTKRAELGTAQYKQACASRMDTELDVMRRCQLADYFLLIHDICKFCDEKGIARGLGRGSCSGSLICYLLDISRANPLQYGLLFERFLNEDRTRPVEFNGETYLTDAPDIDLDVCQLRRQEVVDYLRAKYGHVAKIVTYSTLTTKNCLKQVLRAFGKSEPEANAISGMVEVVFGKNKSLEEMVERKGRFAEWAGNNPQIFKICKKLEDLKSNTSIHAAGILVNSEPISNRCPLMTTGGSAANDFKTEECSAYSLDFASKAGLIKFDLLGLRTLSVLQGALR